jgi:hypothetical protein
MARRSAIQGNADVRRGLDDFVRQLRGGTDAVKDFGAAASRGAQGANLGGVGAGLARAAGFGGIAQGILAGGPVGGALAGLQAATDFVGRTNQAKAQAELAAPLFSAPGRVFREGRAAADVSTLDQEAAFRDKAFAAEQALRRELGPLRGLLPPIPGSDEDGAEARAGARAVREQQFRRFEPQDRAFDVVSSFTGEIEAAGGKIGPERKERLLRFYLDRERRRLASNEDTQRVLDVMEGNVNPELGARLGPR